MKKVIVFLKDESVDREEVTASIENALNGDRKVICVNANIISDIKLIDYETKSEMEYKPLGNQLGKRLKA